MKKILIVNAHPEAASFCSSLKETAKDYFVSKGYEVKESAREQDFPLQIKLEPDSK